MKRFISMLILTALLSMSMITTVFAAGETISVASVDAVKGETVSVPVVLSGNTGFDNYEMTLDYDAEALELTGISGTYVTAGNTANGKVVYAAANNVNDEEVTLFTATFKVKEDADEGAYPVSVTVQTIGISYPSSVMEPSVNSGSVTLSDSGVPETTDTDATETATAGEELNNVDENDESVTLSDSDVLETTDTDADETVAAGEEVNNVDENGGSVGSWLIVAVLVVVLLGTVVIIVQRKRKSAK